MTEKKRNQEYNGATPRNLCPKCGEYLKKNYTREQLDVKQLFVNLAGHVQFSAVILL